MELEEEILRGGTFQADDAEFVQELLAKGEFQVDHRGKEFDFDPHQLSPLSCVLHHFQVDL